MDTSDLENMKRLVKEYEQDPEHKITEEHIKARQACVMKYGQATVLRKIKQVYKELYNWE